MTPGAIYDTKRANFKAKTLHYFAFLCAQAGFATPVHEESRQPNGVVITDRFIYQNDASTIYISNSYHPVDYGFSIDVHWGSKPHLGPGEMIYYVLKEDQDMEQTYLEYAAEYLRHYLGTDKEPN